VPRTRSARHALPRAGHARLDGNTVELSTEQTLFAENAVQYRTTLAFLEGRINHGARALKGE
jgi:flagellar basal-body rod protein FlgB